MSTPDATPAGPALRYYGPLVGAWSGPFFFALRGDRAAAPLLVRLFALFARLGARMATTLAPGSAPHSFRHTTRVRVLGVEVYRTEEQFVIDEGGARFEVEGTQGALLARSVAYRCDGEVAADATGATYRLSFMGAPLVQRTQLMGGELELRQETAFSEGRVVLSRRG